MPSPFPGMDPYIEARREWSDFQVDLATELRTALNILLAANYYAVTTTYATYDIIQVAQHERRSISPDVSIWHTAPSSSSSASVGVIDAPTVRSRVPLEVEVRIANVEVHETGTDRLRRPPNSQRKSKRGWTSCWPHIVSKCSSQPEIASLSSTP